MTGEPEAPRVLRARGHHVQHVYQKAGVRSRAAATVWALENDLVHAS